MRIAVTGGTGYVGAHIVRGLLAAGHQVKLLVEPNWQNETLLAGLNELGSLELLRGDLRSADIVDELLDGCDAVLHAAGVVGTDDSRAELMWDINAYASERIMRRGVELDLDPIVMVSSYAALFPPPGPVIGPDTPPAESRSAYGKTKAYADRVARELQAQGHPVVVSYPSSVVGPAWHTPPGITEQGFEPIVKFGVAPGLKNAGMQMIDVRDVADAHVAMMRPGAGPHRYICGGQMLAFNEMIDAIERGRGRKVRRIPLTGNMFRVIGRVSDFLGAVLPLGSGFSYEAAQLMTAAIPTDDSATLSDLGLTWHSPAEAMVASIRQSAGGQ